MDYAHSPPPFHLTRLAAQETCPRERPVMFRLSQMKKGPEAVLLSPIQQDAQAVSLRLHPPLRRRPSFFRRTHPMIAFRVTSATLRLLLRALCKTHTPWGSAF